eukprot:tig00020965_g16842.t1
MKRPASTSFALEVPKLPRTPSADRLNAMRDTVLVRSLPHIKDLYPETMPMPSPLATSAHGVSAPTDGSGGTDCSLTFVEPGTLVLADIVFREIETDEKPLTVSGPFYLRAGPFEEIFCDPKTVKACIVTCGGLCPGLNNVIREIVMTLWYNYGCKDIYGIQYGYRGFYDPALAILKLDPTRVSNIHHQGGTILGSSRGGFDKEAIISSIIDHGFNQVYIVGGDGTHRGAQIIFDECYSRGHKVLVAGVPKTIDNDIAIIDKSFGFDTAVQEATRAINSAHVEAECAPNGISIVKLMGRNAGFLAMYAALASRDVNVCLIPEVKFRMEPLFAYLERRIRERGHAVVLVAEGAGQDLLPATGATDASGNVRLGDIGAFLKKEIEGHFKKIKMESNVKYIDPTYMIRTLPANASDTVYIAQLVQNCVHGVMAGYTGFTVGMINSRVVYLPFEDICGRPQHVDPSGRMYQRLIASTGQPSLY